MKIRVILFKHRKWLLKTPYQTAPEYSFKFENKHFQTERKNESRVMYQSPLLELVKIRVLRIGCDILT